MTIKTPPPRPNTPIIDKDTGMMTKEWMRFFLLFFASEDATEQVVVDNTTQINSLNAQVISITQSILIIIDELNKTSAMENTDFMLPINAGVTTDSEITVTAKVIQRQDEVVGFMLEKVITESGYELSIVANTNQDYSSNITPLVPTFDFTPVIKGSVVSGTNTYSIQTGKWTRVNGLITIKFIIELSSFDALTSGNIMISGLPVPSLEYSRGSVTGYVGVTLPAGKSGLTIKTTASSSELSLQYNGNSTTYASVTNSDITNPLLISGEISYRG